MQTTLSHAGGQTTVSSYHRVEKFQDNSPVVRVFYDPDHPEFDTTTTPEHMDGRDQQGYYYKEYSNAEIIKVHSGDSKGQGDSALVY